MAIYYHGTSKLFKQFDLSHVLEGDGKCKFGIGIYLTEVYETAAHYADPSADVHYVYTVECPDLTETNHIVSAKPVNDVIVKKTEDLLGIEIPNEERYVGKLFRKYIGNYLNDEKLKSGSASIEAEKKASAFLSSIGVNFFVWPRAQTKPDGPKNIAVLDDKLINILKIEQVELDKKGHLVLGSQKELSF